MTYGQMLVSGTQIATFSAADISAQTGIQVPYGVTAYKILYTTPGSDGITDTASGLLCIPDDDQLSYPMLSYNHGTTSGKQDCPSNLQGGSHLSLAFASQGYIVCAADYLGMGESRGFHPYVHAQTEAQASVDMLFACKTFLTGNGIAFEDQLFISGYSQGGHAGMAAQKLIEDQYASDFNLTACSHMSGPYSISKVMKDVILADVDYDYPAFVCYAVMGYQEVYGNLYNDINDIFKSPYSGLAQQFYNGTINLTNLNLQLLIQMNLNEGNAYPYSLLQDSITHAIQSDPGHPINIALGDNDVWNFSATTPTRLYYCGADEQVTHINSIFADSAMNANGAADLQAVQMDPNQSHSGCIPLAGIATLLFFDQYATIGLEDRSETPTLRVYPNPVTEWVHIELPSEEKATISVVNGLGKRVYYRELVPAEYIAIPVSDWSSGLYMLSVLQTNKLHIRRLQIK